MMVRSEDEVDKVYDVALDQAVTGKSKWIAQTYEQGVVATIEWLYGDREESPMEE